MAVKVEVLKPGMFTTVQDLGRRGYQMQGVPVAGAMDAQALRIGNVLTGSEEGAAALEITMIGPTLKIAEGEACFAVTGADVGVLKNGVPLPCWKTFKASAGDTLGFLPPVSGGARAYLCVSGGFDVPLIMGSRSTYTRGRFGGVDGRALKAGDILKSAPSDLLWAECEGLECPVILRPIRDPDALLRVVPGPQEDYFSEEGLKTFYSSEYVISNSADRMGYRMEGAVVAHNERGPDIVSDAICMGSVQVPGHGQPIVMLADRQTTGGYTKIGTVCSADVANLAQRLPGAKVRFSKITVAEAVALMEQDSKALAELKCLRASWRSRPESTAISCELLPSIAEPSSGVLRISLEGITHRVEWEKIS